LCNFEASLIFKKSEKTQPLNVVYGYFLIGAKKGGKAKGEKLIKNGRKPKKV